MTYTIIDPDDLSTLPPNGETVWLFERDYGWILGVLDIDADDWVWSFASDYPRRAKGGEFLEAVSCGADDLDVLAWAPFVVPEVPEEYK